MAIADAKPVRHDPIKSDLDTHRLCKPREAAGDKHGKPAMGPVSQALRVALTGSTVSPGIGETLAVLGKASSLARLRRCLDAFAT